MQEHHAAWATLGNPTNGIFHNPDHYRSGKNRERGGAGPDYPADRNGFG